MKKTFVTLLFCFLLSAIAIGCGSKEKEEDSKEPNTSSEETGGDDESETGDLSDLDGLGDIGVDDGLFNVKLNIPADYIGDTTQEELDKIASEGEFKSITLNEDGSATYIMTKKQREKMLGEIRDDIIEGCNDMVTSGDYPSFTSIDVNDNVTEFTVRTKSTELDLEESFSVMAFYMYGGMYSIFSGEEIDNVSVTFVNDETGDVIEVANSSDIEE